MVSEATSPANTANPNSLSNNTVAFVGLGVMGFPMARHLLDAGCAVRVYNRTPAKSESFVAEHGGEKAITPREAAQGSDVVFMCVGNDDDVRSVCYPDDGIFAGLASGTLVIDHTTASAGLAQELAEVAKDKGCGFLDAPVSGGQAGAENGVLTVMVGGEQNDYERAVPFFNVFARAHRLLGDVGSDSSPSA